MAPGLSCIRYCVSVSDTPYCSTLTPVSCHCSASLRTTLSVPIYFLAYCQYGPACFTVRVAVMVMRSAVLGNVYTSPYSLCLSAVSILVCCAVAAVTVSAVSSMAAIFFIVISFNCLRFKYLADGGSDLADYVGCGHSVLSELRLGHISGASMHVHT